MLIPNGKTTDLRISRNYSISMKNTNIQILYKKSTIKAMMCLRTE